MMHHDGFVITLVNDARKPYRETGHKRVGGHSSAEVRIPFDSEYQFLIRVRDDTRRRAVFEIDGANVGELIFSEGTQYLERFIEDSDRKFKFVSAENESVPDPDNPGNGKIVVKVYKEKPFCFSPFFNSWSANHFPHPMFPGPHYREGETVYETLTSGITRSSSANSISLSLSGTSDLGATIEGGTSNQTFGSTHWRGDAGSPNIFTFRVRGLAQEQTETCYCHGCGTEAGVEHIFCSSCGLELTSKTSAV